MRGTALAMGDFVLCRDDILTFQLTIYIYFLQEDYYV